VACDEINGDDKPGARAERTAQSIASTIVPARQKTTTVIGAIMLLLDFRLIEQLALMG
jgi:hypothetical protein